MPIVAAIAAIVNVFFIYMYVLRYNLNLEIQIVYTALINGLPIEYRDVLQFYG